MKYIALTDFKHAWIFRHAEMTVSCEDQQQIKPMTATAANDLWRNNISKQGDNPDEFADNDWPVMQQSWQEQGEWQDLWDSDDPALPVLITTTLDWTPETTVYYCIDNKTVFETRWDIFCRHWKNFLFFDDNTLLLGRKRKQAVQFHQDGSFAVGLKGTVPSAEG